MTGSSAENSNADPPDAYEPTEVEIAQMRAATPEEGEAVDAMILRECSVRWQKVAKIVGSLLDEFERAYPHLPFAYVRARMQELEDLGSVEIAGDVWVMRSSEIRLVREGQEFGANNGSGG